MTAIGLATALFLIALGLSVVGQGVGAVIFLLAGFLALAEHVRGSR